MRDENFEVKISRQKNKGSRPKRPLTKRTKAVIYILVFVAVFIPMGLKNPCEDGIPFRSRIAALALSPAFAKCPSNPLGRLVTFYLTKHSPIWRFFNQKGATDIDRTEVNPWHNPKF